MTKAQANKLSEFIVRHYDSVSQEEYFELCDIILQAIVHDANQQGWAKSIAIRFPQLFCTE
ncbi:MAG: hypothetical protein ACSW8D_08195 [Prevotella sp.]